MIVKSGIATRIARRALIAATAFAVTLAASAATPALASEETTFTFSGGGWGHGIGMSQYGAKGYANKGWTYDRILKHFYQGTRIETKPTVTVRVNLDKNKSARVEWRIQAGTDTTLTVTQLSDRSVFVALRELVAGTPATYWITTSASDTRLHRDDNGRPGTIIQTFDGRCFVSSSSPIRIVGKSGPFDHVGVRWRGRLHFVPDTATTSDCVNYVNIEDYLKGVVPRESPSSWPAEALKAQAVAARSYAYDDAVNKRVLWCTIWSQVYNGHSRPGYNHEPATTTSAIAATRGKLVWYGTETKPVKTFFFSSSGGHTANIEDVWLSSTPKPYYKGVTDDDAAGNPYYRWTASPLTATSLSGKVRSRVGTSFSAPAPHVINNITLERAASGYTRYANISWTNGRTYRIKGDTLRSVLRLNSTKFSVSIKRPGPVVTPYSEKDPNLAWSGIWSPVEHVGAYGGAYRRTSLPGSTLVTRFNGTGISWIGVRGPSFGRARVKLDGTVVATVDLYSSKTLTRQVLFSRTGLSSGEHTMTITALNSRDSRSSRFGTSIDRINVTGGSLLDGSTPVQRYEESWNRVVEFGGWSSETTSVASGGSRISNAHAGSRVIVDFVGTGIDWIGSTAPGFGSARVSINGSAPTTISLAAATTTHQRTLFATSSLSPNRTHRIVIEVVGPTSSSAGTVTVDRFDVTGGWVVAPNLPVKRFQETSAVKTGSWKVYRNTLASGGTHIVSGVKGASVTIPFEGTSITWRGARTRQYGKAEVLLDGKRVAVVDLYNPTTKLNQKLWSRSGLSAKRHTLTIRVLGTKRSAAAGTLVSVDAFDIRGQLAPRP